MQAPSGSPEQTRQLFVADLAKEQPTARALLFIKAPSEGAGDAADISTLEIMPSMAGGIIQAMLGDLLNHSNTSSGCSNGSGNKVPSSAAAPGQAPHDASFSSFLRRPDSRFFPNNQEISAVVTPDSPAAMHLAAILEEWCSTVDTVIKAGNNQKSPPCSNLEAALQQWKERNASLSALLSESPQSFVAAVCRAAAVGAPAALKRWRQAEVQLGEAALRAEECVTVLIQLGPPLAPFFHDSESAGPMTDLLSLMPRAFQRLQAVTTASQVYSQPMGLADLLGVLGLALAKRSRDSVAQGGKLWDQPKSALLEKLDAIVKVHALFESQCTEILTSVVQGADKGQVVVSSALNVAARPFTFVAKRCAKLYSLFATVMRITMLGKQSHIPGVSAIATSFFEIVGGLKRGSASTTDVLDFASSADGTGSVAGFERDMLDFQVHVNDLELALQDALRASFEAAVTTEHALGLLRQHAALLPADVVESEVDAMFATAFRRFAADVEAVQEHYEKYKTEPPVPRGATPVAGAIQWSRNLLRRIERPMRQFAAHEPLISAKESKKTIKAYNRLAQTLLEFEGLMHAAWAKNADAVVAKMQVPVLVQHPTTMHLYVNLDAAVQRVLQEGAWLGRLGLPLPATVRKAMLAGELLKSHYGALTAAVAALAGAQATLPPALRPLGQTMARGVVHRASPGLTTVFWTSATLGGFIHAFSQSVHRFCEVARRVGDMHVHRVEAAARAVSKIEFMALSSSASSLPCAEFVKSQEVRIAEQTAVLFQKDSEARTACEEVVELVAKELQQSGLHMDLKSQDHYLQHCGKMLRQAAEEAAAATITTLQKKLQDSPAAPATPPKSSAANLLASSANSMPFFALELRLDAPVIGVHPSLPEVKTMLSSCASSVLAVANKLPPWGNNSDATNTKDGKEAAPSKPPLRRGSVLAPQQRRGSIAGAPSQPKPALQSLAEAVDGMREAVAAHLRAFQPFAFLWTTDKEGAYATFMEGRPTLEDSEDQLRKLASLQADLEAVPTSLRISGALSLATDPLKHAVRAEIADWKAQFAQRLHAHARRQLQELQIKSRDLLARLSRKVEDIQDVAAVIKALEEAREGEAEEEQRTQILEELYALLVRHGIRVPKDESDALGDLLHSQRMVKQTAGEASQTLAASQDGFVQGVRSLSAALAQDSSQFRTSWDAYGPTVPGLAPPEASARLEKFKAEFESYRKRWERVGAGELLFGLPRTPLPGLEKIQEEIIALDQLYSLYKAVMGAVKERGTLPWTAAVATFDTLGGQVAEFQASSKKMPKSLREWPAFKECRGTIDELVGLLPLLEGLSHSAVRDRHWKEVSAITGVALPLPTEGLTLGHLLGAGLLSHREELEELCAAVVKEDALERKLKAVGEQWEGETFTFTEHKQRGPVILKVRKNYGLNIFLFASATSYDFMELLLFVQ